MMKLQSKLIVTILFTITSIFSYGQIENPVKWTYSSEKIEGSEYNIVLQAEIEDTWHLYSQFLGSDDGPIATRINFKNGPGYSVLGKVDEGTPLKEYDENFQMDLKFFEHRATFKQRVKVEYLPITVRGDLEFMVCDASKCLPPEWSEFEVTIEDDDNLNGSNSSPLSQNEASVVPENPMDNGIKTPIKWKQEKKDLGKGEFEITFTATIEEGWHLYSQHIKSQDGPVVTNFTFKAVEGIELVGEVIEIGDRVDTFDEMFDMELAYFEHAVTFSQKVKAGEGPGKIQGYFEYMTCNETQCLPPEIVDFKYVFNEDKSSIKGSGEVRPTESNANENSMWTIFILSFLSGFAALLTPCVFPMIPMTVSFFTKQSKSKAAGIRNAWFYGLCIIGIYVALGTVVTKLFGADALNQMATDPIFNIVFFLLLVVFAISFMGAFEITMPSSWVNKADAASDKGGMIGIFFMALVLALVSFSCTGPIVGALLVQAATMGGVAPFVGMFGFSFALALPFGLFAAFPGWMNSLPKSGGWLNTVKVVLGFLELALAFKFLSNADLVLQWHFLERELFLAIWIGIFLVLGLYLLGFITLPHDSPLQYLSVGRALFGTFVLVFVIYLLPGMWGAPVQLISGFPPPMAYSESPLGVGFMGGGSGDGSTHNGPEGTHLGPQGINLFHDYDEGIAYAKKIGKPAFLDFTGHACVNCRKMEENVWGKPGIIDIMRNDVVIISLYVDDKRELPEEEQRVVEVAGLTKNIRTIGNEWSLLEMTKYKTNTQPFYIMLGPNGEDLTNGSADYEHHSNPEDFKKWLNQGLELYNKAQ